jgi:urease accessory protein
MGELTIIRAAMRDQPPHGNHVRLPVTRATLAKRRWRGRAEDGREFGFDLDKTLAHGSHFFAEGATHYVLEQQPEKVLEIPVGTPEQAARVAWNLGNLHFPVQVLTEAVRVTEDPAVLQFLAREEISFQRVICTFLPLSSGAPSHHHNPIHRHK